MDVVTAWTGALAHQLRHAMRMSAEEFAALLDVAPRSVATWDARPEAEPALRTQQLLDTALERASDTVKARFSAMRQHPAANATQATSVFTAGPTLLPTSAPVVTQAPVAAPSREHVDWLARSLREHYQADNLLGPAVLLPVLTAHLGTIGRMRRTATGSVLADLLQVGAGYAEFAGWLSQDAGDLAGANQLYGQGMELAQAAGDDRMAAFILVRRAVQALAANEAAYAARLAQAAQRNRSPLTARVRAIAAQTEAIGHARAGDASEAARALDTAEKCTAEAEGVPADGDPSDGRYCELPLYLRISRAKVHLTLGDGPSAVTAFGDVLAVLPAAYRRDRGQYLAHLAHASALAGLPEQACAQATESLAIAIETGSLRTLRDLRAMVASLDNWSSLREVTQLRDCLAAAIPSLTEGAA